MPHHGVALLANSYLAIRFRAILVTIQILHLLAVVEALDEAGAMWSLRSELLSCNVHLTDFTTVHGHVNFFAFIHPSLNDHGILM